MTAPGSAAPQSSSPASVASPERGESVSNVGLGCLPGRAQLGHRSFAVERQHDESGVSGTGVVLEGVVFATGLTVVHWLTPAPRGSLNVFESFEQFMSIHVGPHPTNQTRIHWSNGTVWEPGDYPAAPTPWSAP